MQPENNIPQHVAIIMDGNGRWAKKRNLPRTQGHIEGVKRAEEIVEAARTIGIKYLTLFTFSTENWRRPQAEVSLLMNMLADILKKKINRLQEGGVRFKTIGCKEGMPEAVLKVVNDVSEATKNNSGMTLILALNYGSRLEIIEGIKKIAQAVKDNQIHPNQIDEETISQSLYTAGCPDPDLLIRTSGEQRISNFLLWQLSYSEFYFTDVFWPDFNADELKKAVEAFKKRERRFGQAEVN